MKNALNRASMGNLTEDIKKMVKSGRDETKKDLQEKRRAAGSETPRSI